MAIIQWSDEYLINIEEIDKQHHKLFEMVKSLEDCGDEESCAKKMGETIKGLAEYTQYHFAEEEKVMQEYDYPEFELHKVSHKYLIKQIKAILIRMKKGKDIQYDELHEFLINWLREHIIVEDKQIGRHIAQVIKSKKSPAVS